MAKAQENYKNGDKLNKVKLRTEFNQFKLQEEYYWIREVGGTVTSQVFEDLQDAFEKFFKGRCKYPKFKSKKKTKQSFYVRHDRMAFKNNTVNIEKVGRVKYSSNYNIPQLPKYMNPRCRFDGKYWYLCFGYEQENNIQELNQNLSMGIDLGIKDLAITSIEGLKFKNINKTKKIIKLKGKLKRLQRQVSRKYKMNKQGVKFVKTNNIIKLEKQIKLIYRQLKNTRLNHIHQATNKIVKTKPSRVVMETLNIKGMMKNKHLSKVIQEQCLYEFKRQMRYKCEFNGIEFVEADKWYPSSKTCSECGHIKKDLKLSDRVYICTECGCVIDRDYNAAVNLSRYSA